MRRQAKVSPVKREDWGLASSSNLTRAQSLVAELKREDPATAHTRLFVGTTLLSYAEKLDDAPGDPILARTCGMLEAEYRGDVPPGTWSASPEPQIVWEHVFPSSPSR
jgi:hypothetical protein